MYLYYESKHHNYYLLNNSILPGHIARTNNKPINTEYIQKKTRVKIWLYEDTRMAIEGQIVGFDEYMNLTIDDAFEM